MGKTRKKVRYTDERNHVQEELIEYYGGKSVPHRDKSKYKRKPKHKTKWEEE